MNEKKEEDREIYWTFRKGTKKLVLEKKKRISWDKKCKEIETYISGRWCIEARKFLKNIRKEDSYSWQGIFVNAWKEYYKILFKETRNEYQCRNWFIKTTYIGTLES